MLIALQGILKSTPGGEPLLAAVLVKSLIYPMISVQSALPTALLQIRKLRLGKDTLLTVTKLDVTVCRMLPKTLCHQPCCAITHCRG
jgi:hypothetical protein